MNRETKRLLQRQGALNEEGSPTRAARQAPSGPPKERTPLPVFIKEVKGELRKVAWPTKSEVINYSIIVLVTVAVMTGFIALLDWIFGSLILRLFDQ